MMFDEFANEISPPRNPIPPPGKAKKGPWKIDLQGMDVDDVREMRW